MPKKRAEDKFAELDEDELASVALFRELAVRLGRAIGLSCIAATCSATTEDAAIAAADRTWTELADSIIELAMDD